MDPAAVLHVLVKVDGINRAAQDVRQLDSQMEAAAASADRMDREVAGMDATMRKAASTASDVARASRTLDTDLRRAAKAAGDSERQHTRLAAAWTRVTSAGRGLVDRLRAVGGGGDDGGRGLRRFLDSMGDLPGRMYLSTRLIGALMNALLTLSPILLAVGAGIFAVVSALGPLVGLGAAAAGGMLALAQGMGVLKLATMGVGGALSEQLKAQSMAGPAAVKSAGQQRAAARAVESAMRAQRDAAAGLSEALSQARLRLTDVRAAAVDADLALRGARLAANDARVSLAALLAGPDPRALAEAHDDVRDALRGEERAALALTDAHAALNALLSGPDPLDIAEAHDRVQDAMRGEQRAAANLADQVKRTNAVLSSPTASEPDKARARLDLADAENAVGDSKRETIKAQRDLAQLEAGPSQEAIARARLEVKDAEHAVADAKRGTADAQRDLAKLEAGPSHQEIAAARLAVAQAEDAVSDAIRDHGRAQRELNRAEALGVAGAKEVVAARQAVKDATRALSDAQISANESAATAAVSAGALNDKFNDLPAAAQAFVRVLIGLKPKMDELRASAAQGLFPGVTAGLQSAMGSFGSVKTVVGQTATEIGGLAARAGALVGSSAFGRDIETIGGRNAKILGSFGRSALHLGDAFRHVLVAAGPLTSWMAKLVEQWTRGAAQSAEAARQSGRLADFFDKTRERATLLGSILANIATGLLGMGKASDKSGAGMLRDLDALTERFSAWANSVRGRADVAEFMDRVRDALKRIGPALGAVLAAFGNFAANVLPAYARVLGALAPVMDEIVTTFIAWKIAATAAAIATGVWTTFTTAHVRAIVAQKIAMVAASAATKAWAAAQWLLNAAMTANPIGLVVVALAALAAAAYVAYQKSETFRDIVDAVAGALRDALQAVIGFVTDLSGMPEKMQAAGKAILHGIVGGIKALPAALLEAAGWVKNRVVEGIKAYVGSYVTVGKWVVNRLVEGVQAMASALGVAAGWVKAQVVEGLHAVSDGFVGVGKWVVNRLAEGVMTITEKVASVPGWLRKNLADLFDKAKDGFVGIGGTLVDWIASGLKGGLKQIGNFAKKILDIVGKIPGVGSIANKGKAAIDKVLDGAAATGGAVSRNGLQQLARGGIVRRPKILVGEEAPTHPEFVIPTNPAYRGRAQALLADAAERIGMYAQGGVIGRHGDEKGGLDPFGLVGDAFNVISKGPGALLKMLPNPKDMLPDWLHGTGTWAIGKASEWIKDKVGGLLKGIVGGDGKPGSGGGNFAAVTKLAAKFGTHTGGQGQGFRPGDPGLHGVNRARDYSGGDMLGFARALASSMGSKLLELIHTPLGWGIKNGKRVGLDFWGPAVNADHFDHVHAALAQGGWLARSGFGGAPFVGSYKDGGTVPQDGFAYVHRNETITPAGASQAPLVHVEHLEVRDAFDLDEIASKLAWKLA